MIPYKITRDRGSADVEWRGRKARFDGELGLGGFQAGIETMKWMYPEIIKESVNSEDLDVQDFSKTEVQAKAKIAQLPNRNRKH